MITLKDHLGGSWPIIFHLTITGRCNATCEGCLNSLIYGQRESFAKAWEGYPEKDLQALHYLIQSVNGEPIYIAFYGGEPLLVFPKMKRILEELKRTYQKRDLRFLLYTNGMLLGTKVLEDSEFFSQLELLVVSIDGTTHQHERYRRGTFLARIEKNLKILKECCDTKVLMWSTLREGMSFRDCLEEFLMLFRRRLVDFYFWHLIETDRPMVDLEFFRENYFRDLRFLLEEFTSELAQGRVLPILPLVELTYFLLKGIRRGQTGCGVESLRNLDILAGKVLPCVDLGDELVLADFQKGEGSPPEFLTLSKELFSLVSYKEWLGCNRCEAEFFCGGRCPVLSKASPERAKQYCLLTRDLVSLTQNFLPEIERSLVTGDLSLDDLYYPYGYLNLLTDVVP